MSGTTAQKQNRILTQRIRIQISILGRKELAEIMYVHIHITGNVLCVYILGGGVTVLSDSSEA